MMKPISQVSVAYGGNLIDRMRRCLNTVGVGESITKLPAEGTIVVKPNYARARKVDKERGAFEAVVTVSGKQEGDLTHPEVLEALLRYLRDHWRGTLIIAEGSGGCYTPIAFRENGIDIIAKKYGAELIDLNWATSRLMKVPRGIILNHIWIPDIILFADLLISLPALKTWAESGISLGMKNFIGVLPGKYYGWNKAKGQYVPGEVYITHREEGDFDPEPDALAGTIVDICSVRAPDLTVIDGTTMLYGQWGPESDLGIKQADVLIAGWDPVAVDAIGAQMLGYEPPVKLKSLCWAERKGLGSCSKENISVVQV